MLKDSPALFEIDRPLNMTTQEYIYQRLRKSIMLGLTVPGKPITIRGIADALETSPTPVREALRRLSTEHGLKMLPNRRIVVPQMTSIRFKELILLRVTLEIHAACAALPFITNHLVNDLSDLDLEIDAAVEKENYNQQIILNQQFHELIYTANSEQVIMPMIESIWLQLGPFNRIAARNIKEFYVVDHHKEILSALHGRHKEDLKVAINADIKGAVGQLHPDALERILK